MEKFKNLLLGTFDHAEDDKLYMIAKEYHQECDSFDQRVCTAKGTKGQPLPDSRHELAAINKNAHQVRKRLINNNREFSPTQIHRAILRYS